MITIQTPRQHGFSAIETVVTIAITTLVLAALTASVVLFYRANGFAVEQAFAVESGRKGVEFVVRDIREASFSDEGAYPIIAIDDHELYFYSDIDRDNSIERVRFFLATSTQTFHRVVTDATGTPPTYGGGLAATSTLAQHVRNDEQARNIFEYFDDEGTRITNYNNITDVAFVRVNLIVNVNPAKLPNEFTLRSSATLRNLKVNL